jgi:D-beta-D-heptose 7-phosphate kinase/D-beta-D-heptose 1-phosphate adenosyltransferase
MGRLDARRLERLVRRFEGLRLLVIGDVMVDEYLWGDVDRVNPEAPVPVVLVARESTALGGAGNVLRNAAALGAGCALCAVVGEDAAGDRVIDLLKDLGVDPSAVVRVAGRPTTQKTRVEARSQQMLRFDRETEEPISRAVSTRLMAAIEALLPKTDGVILEDYGKGLLTAGFVKSLMRRAAEFGVPVTVDPKFEIAMFREAALVKPNVREIEAFLGTKIRTREDLVAAGNRLRKKLGGSPLVVTRGADGMTVFDKEKDGVDVPVARRKVFDVQGAGDTSIVALSLAQLVGASLVEAAVIANAAAAVVVAKVGTATATADEITALLPDAIAAARRAGRA